MSRYLTRGIPITVYKMIEVVGTSNTSFSDAVRGAVRRASETLEDLSWFEVKEMRGRIGENGDIAEFQVKLDIGFRLHATSEGTTSKAHRQGLTTAARSAAAQRATAKKGRARKAPRRNPE